MSKIIPGSIVYIRNLQKKSFYLYKSYLRFSQLMVCPCHLKKGVHLIIEDIVNGVAIMKGRNADFLTVTYVDDLSLVYE